MAVDSDGASAGAVGDATGCAAPRPAARAQWQRPPPPALLARHCRILTAPCRRTARTVRARARSRRETAPKESYPQFDVHVVFTVPCITAALRGARRLPSALLTEEFVCPLNAITCARRTTEESDGAEGTDVQGACDRFRLTRKVGARATMSVGFAHGAPQHVLKLKQPPRAPTKP